MVDRRSARAQEASGQKEEKLPIPSPSASILLISPQNTILLLHRVSSSISFASAHVFPGGHISPQDGYLPPLEDPRRHEDSEAYRMGAIRECFEESGILLARRKVQPDEMLSLGEIEREKGRHAIHEEEIGFSEWLQSKGGVPDMQALHAFTRWLTPTNVPRRRFSTQMYLYFLPLKSSSSVPQEIQTPTSDGGIEHTTAEFLPVSDWIRRFKAEDIILYPPQFFLLSLIAPFLNPLPEATDTFALEAQRQALLEFVGHQEDGEPTWAEKCISPHTLIKDGKRMYMSLEQAGPEVEGFGRRGDGLRLISQVFRQGMPRDFEVCWKEDILREKERLGKDQLSKQESTSGETRSRAIVQGKL